ncbi:uncharacterized protein C8Q71DRAFT_745018 [Rhodofomes roseus]|uniref:Uncharacterized protein n=1 Tax=Rhodofomes roseus TaxID=34475 RepID=A0ABQ8KP01_9APHY|nr:uncharacterized protein C8Q71DRAFT_745018 [Rhodofomes roseus]KAH9839949.1 hypothetical protein C8Q71DRAFT_745018 [Rhodofomes roseus]
MLIHNQNLNAPARTPDDSNSSPSPARPLASADAHGSPSPSSGLDSSERIGAPTGPRLDLNSPSTSSGASASIYAHPRTATTSPAPTDARPSSRGQGESPRNTRGGARRGRRSNLGSSSSALSAPTHGHGGSPSRASTRPAEDHPGRSSKCSRRESSPVRLTQAPPTPRMTDANVEQVSSPSSSTSAGVPSSSTSSTDWNDVDWAAVSRADSERAAASAQGAENGDSPQGPHRGSRNQRGRYQGTPYHRSQATAGGRRGRGNGRTEGQPTGRQGMP